jgi:1-acyl-sn-glycerol-3-phosphate acyltransferase
MSIDGFKPEHRDAFVAFDARAAERLYGLLGWLSRHLAVDVEGIEKIPKGRALLVANHAFGWDIAFPMAAIWNAEQRPVWALGEHAWWKVPFLRRLAASVGTVDGTRENVDRLLSRDELVLVLPGGLREALKPRELRYRLLWGHRYGFIRAAIRNQAPLVPLAAIGADDVFDLIGNAFRRGERVFHTKKLPIPRPAHLVPIPHFVRLRYVVGDPILPRARPEQADDEELVRRLRHEVEGALHELIETELAARAGIDAG